MLRVCSNFQYVGAAIGRPPAFLSEGAFDTKNSALTFRLLSAHRQSLY